jgi:hypothetical protein
MGYQLVGMKCSECPRRYTKKEWEKEQKKIVHDTIKDLT